MSVDIYISTAHKVLNSRAEARWASYVIMKTMFPPVHYQNVFVTTQNGFVATQALGHIMYLMYTELL